MNKFLYWDDEWDEQDVPIKNQKRIKDEIKRNKIKNNRSRGESSRATDKGSEGGHY